jgi:hypothetical protein
MREYCECSRTSDIDGSAANTPAPECQARGWEDLANEYGITDMMDLVDDEVQPESTVEEEYMAYTTAPLSPKGTNIIKFWEVRSCNGVGCSCVC